MSCWSQERDNGHYRTCCCHVRTATICLGVYSLLVDVLNICVTLALVIEPDFTPHRTKTVTSHAINTELYHSVNNLSINANASSRANRNGIPSSRDAQFVKLVVSFLTAFFSTCLIYGTVKIRPSFLLPYFCIQLFDFCVSCLAVVGCFTDESNVRIFFVMQVVTSLLKYLQEWFPMREQLLSLSSGWLMFFAGILAIIYLCVKAYLISIVWNCYKYLVMMHRVLPTVSLSSSGHSISHRLSPVQSVTAAVDAATTSQDAEVLLPPKYEDIALHMDHSPEYTPPPSYTDVTQQRTD